jgi:heme-degrading monooxygenase HmoA
VVLVISRFKVANGMEREVRDAFLARPRLVDDVRGFLGIEVFTDTDDTSSFCLVTRWTDLPAYRVWHDGDAHHQSHRGIPKGLKLTPGCTQVIHLDRLHEPTAPMALEELVADSVSALTEFLADSRSIHVLFAAMDGTVRFCNTALSTRLRIDPVARLVWDLVAEQETEALRRRLTHEATSDSPRFLVNFVDADHCPFTLVCQIEVRRDGFLLLGEPPLQSNDATQEEMLRLNNELVVLSRDNVRRGRQLERALEEIKATTWHLTKIQEVLPICMECGKVKTSAKWEDVLSYFKEHAPFLSHGYCPDCLARQMSQLNLPAEE